MCISYRRLNKISNPLEYHISRCDVAIEDIGDENSFIYFINLDTAQSYYQDKNRPSDIDNFVFCAKDNIKYAFIVMIFGTRNVSTHYTIKIHII